LFDNNIGLSIGRGSTCHHIDFEKDMYAPHTL
jgi:hypothetical protein